MKTLYKKLGHEFKDQSLLELALTHRSCNTENNERLEFLGDAVLGVIIAQQLFTQYPDMAEGQLSRLRANLVNGEVLAKLSKELTINEHMHLGQGEIRSGGIKRRSILSNSVEAVIGAIYLDGGMKACQKAVLSWYKERLKEVDVEGPKKDPKTTLQEYLQAKQMALPKYTIIKMGGKEHNQIFEVQCEVQGFKEKALGTGSSRRRAEQDAAEKFLALL